MRHLNTSNLWLTFDIGILNSFGLINSVTTSKDLMKLMQFHQVCRKLFWSEEVEWYWPLQRKRISSTSKFVSWYERSFSMRWRSIRQKVSEFISCVVDWLNPGTWVLAANATLCYLALVKCPPSFVVYPLIHFNTWDASLNRWKLISPFIKVVDQKNKILVTCCSFYSNLWKAPGLPTKLVDLTNSS